MEKFTFLIFLFYTFSGITQEVKVYETFEEFEELLHVENDKVQIVNFWATWCKPCIKELPYFEELAKEAPEEVDITLVSLDFGNQLDSRVIPFIKSRGIESKVVLLDDPKSNVWIDLVNKTWSGAIPATVFYKGEKREFFEKEFHSIDELKEIISSF